MKVLITGGAGFIGANLVLKYLNGEKCEIHIIDNLSTGRFENVKNSIDNRRVKFFNEDICNTNIIEFIKNSKFDYIYNFACPASPKYYLKFPIQTWEANVLGVRNILTAIRGTKTKLLQASTSEVYGSATEVPQRENYWGNVNCTGVRACYDEGKRAAETLIFDYKRLYNVDARVIRIFNTYGPMMDKNDGRVISNFVNQAMTNKDITIYGFGKQTRSFCYIDDMIEAIIKFMGKNISIDKPINIGNSEEIEIEELAILVKRLTNSKSNIVYCKPMEDDPPKRVPDISSATKILNWNPKITLEEGLKNCIMYYNTK